MNIIGRLWDADDDAFLTANYMTMSAVEIARRLGRSYKAVQVRASVKGLARHRHRYSRRLWGEDETRFVLENYGPMSAIEIAAHLGRSEDAVRKWIVRYENNRSIA